MNESEQRKSMISVRGGYSNRNGLNPVCNASRWFRWPHSCYSINKIFEVVDTNTFSDQWRKFAKELLVEVFIEIIYPNNNLTKLIFLIK